MNRPAAIPSVQIDNEQVKVTEWRFPPGAETGWHRHAMYYVVVPQTTGPLLLETAQGPVTSQLTAGLILRALLSGNLELFNVALAELSELPQARVSALLHERGAAGLNALLRRAGLPESTMAAFRIALDVCRENGFVDTVGGAARLRRRMVERVLTHCETDREAAEPLLILLRRFATESAREEARTFCDELLADDVTAMTAHDLIAA